MNKERLIYLYEKEQLSMMEIAEKMHSTHAKVYYWFKKFNIKRRQQKESSYIKHNPKGDPFEIKNKLTAKEKELLLMGLMLYWAEGNKKNKFLVSLGNLDGRMIKLFLSFLRKVCRINEEKIKIYVRLYKEFDRKQAVGYWRDILNLPQKQICVHPHMDPRSKPHKQWSKYGIATIQFANVNLKRWLDENIDKYVGELGG
jgi:hypothetical protein